MNNYIIEVLDNLDNYYMVVEYADDFSLVPDSGYDYKFGISYLNTDIVDDALTVASMEPAYETLDGLAKEVAEPMRALMESFNKISDSYDFADNQYAKAKEFHKEIQENVDSFDELVATVAAYDEAVSDSNQIMKESLSNSAPFDGLLNSLAQSVEWMIKQVESGKPIEDPGSNYLGGTVHIQSVLSQCIGRYNTVFTE